MIVVTRLRRIGRNHKHLLDLVEWFEGNGIDFIVLEQGIDTTTPIGRLFFRFLAALAAFDREAIVEGTLEGLASARARGRVGGRPPKLTQVQLDQAQRMYRRRRADRGGDRRGVRRPGPPCTRTCPPTKTAATASWSSTATPAPARSTDSSRRYGETGQSERVQLDADRKWWPIAPSRQARLKGIVYVVNGTVARIRAVDPDGAWERDDRGYADIPLTAPLTGLQVAEQFPTLGIRLGDQRPHVRGKLREYLPL